MKTKLLKDIDLMEVGKTIQLSGIIFSSNEEDFLCFLPDYVEEEHKPVCLDMTMDDWVKFFRQTDIVETEVLVKDKKGGLSKIILRKSERQIDANVSWKVFGRDNYTCRYCGKTNIPLTVDHIVLWEKGGPSIEKNLLTSCRRCNKIRGNMEYMDWMVSEVYRKVSCNLTSDALNKNLAVIPLIPSIPVRMNKKSR